MGKKLLIICGAEGTGKSTISKAIVKHLSNGVAFDAENILQVSPFEFNDGFQNLAVESAALLIDNYFKHGYTLVVAASFLNDKKWLDAFKAKLSTDCDIGILMINTSQKERDERRLARARPTTREEMAYVDTFHPIGLSLRDSAKDGGYKYAELDNSGLSVESTIENAKKLFPDFFN